MKRIYLEITDTCNLNCPFCSYEKGNRFMSLKMIRDCIRQIRPFCSYVYLHILGEPLLHPDFEKILDALDSNKMKLQLVTNGTLLNKYPDLLKHPCLRKLSISLHSVSGIEISDDYFTTIDGLLEKNCDTAIELRFYDPEHLDQKLKNYLQSLKERYPFEITSKKNSYQLKDSFSVSGQDAQGHRNAVRSPYRRFFPKVRLSL